MIYFFQTNIRAVNYILYLPSSQYHDYKFHLQTGQTPLSIANRLGYISVVEILKHITEVEAAQPSAQDEKYKVVSPETMQETLMTDSEDEGGQYY